MNKREQGTKRRKQAIIGAARSLIEACKSTEFSMNDLATSSGVSIQTIYNIFGSKSSVLYALLNNIVASVDEGLGKNIKSDPIDIFLDSVDSVSAIYLSNPALYSALLRHLFGVRDEVNRQKFINGGRKFWNHALAAVFRDLPDKGISQESIAEDMLYLTTGILETWIQGDIDDRQFKSALRRAGALRLLALNIPGARVRLLSEI